VTAGCIGRLITPAGEAELGSEQAAVVEEQLGLVEHAALQSYVGEVGARLVRGSPKVRDSIEYRFRVIDMPEPNAFALPGGYIYVSRGLVLLLESEDELANVLAHEIAHVSDRHHLQLALRSAPFLPVNLATGIGAAAVGLVSPTLGRGVAAVGTAPSGLVLAGYSRGQETDADELGQELAASAGWDPAAMSRVMESLALDVTQRGGDPGRHSYFATHPTSPDRARRTAERAEAFHVADPNPVEPSRRAFMARLEGLVVGPPARQGVFAGREFLHPVLDFRVAFPRGWELANERVAVRAVSENADAIAVITIGGQDSEPTEVAHRFLEASGVGVEQGPATLQIGPYDAVRVVARSSSGGQRFRYVLTWLGHGELVYQISGGAYERAWQHRSAALDAVARSFRPLASQDWAKIREGRLRVVVAEARTSLADLMPADGAWTLPQAAVANRLDEDAVVPPGTPLKIAPLEPYEPEVPRAEH
jgi:predicted Zn-dependent protease